MKSEFATSAAIALLALTLNSAVAGAQSPDIPVVPRRAVFVEAAVIADHDQTDLTEPGPSLAGGIGIGARLWRRYSLRFEFDRPGQHHALFQDRGIEHREASETTSYAFLLGRHFRNDRTVQVVTLLGVSALTHRYGLTGFIDITPRDGSPATHTVLDIHDVEQWVALSLGFDVPVALSRHLHLVPQLRLHQVANSDIDGLFPTGKTLVRPRLAVRWEF